jgi:hypothetical protein
MSGRQSDISADTSRSLEADRGVDRRLEAERGDRTDTRHGHEPSDLRTIPCQLQNLTIEIVGLLLYGLAARPQRSLILSRGSNRVTACGCIPRWTASDYFDLARPRTRLRTHCGHRLFV